MGHGGGGPHSGSRVVPQPHRHLPQRLLCAGPLGGGAVAGCSCGGGPAGPPGAALPHSPLGGSAAAVCRCSPLLLFSSTPARLYVPQRLPSSAKAPVSFTVNGVCQAARELHSLTALSGGRLSLFRGASRPLCPAHACLGLPIILMLWGLSAPGELLSFRACLGCSLPAGLCRGPMQGGCGQSALTGTRLLLFGGDRRPPCPVCELYYADCCAGDRQTCQQTVYKESFFLCLVAGHRY